MAAQQASQQAAEQAMRDSQQAAQRSIEDAQRASDQAMRDMQQAQDSTTTWPTLTYTDAPKFSVAAGPVTPGTQVRLRSSTHYAVIYYTTNGWTPTTKSKRYTGPITINESTVVQAIAVAPNSQRSLISTAKYIVAAPSPRKEHGPIETSGLLPAGTQLQLVTASSANSKTAQIGDKLELKLAQDLKVGEDVVIPKGTPLEALITQADPAGHVGTPGDLSFEVQPLKVGGISIPLKGGETLEGANHYDRAKGFLFIPVVGLSGLAVHGDQAEIKPGMTLTASVEKDTKLEP